MKSGEKINLLHCILSLVVGGMERLVAETSLRMDKNLFHTEVCCVDDLSHFSGFLMDRGINVTLLKKNQEHYDYFFPLRLMRFLRKKNIHILQMHSGTFFLGAQAGMLARTPATIYTDHGRPLIETPSHLKTDWIAGRLVDRIIAVSSELERHLVEVVKLPKSKVVTVINGINVEEFSPRPKPRSLMREFQIADNYRVVGTVGRLAEVKNQESLIRAFGEVHKRVPDSVLMLVGDGPMRQKLLDTARQSGVEKSVIITGNRRDVPVLLNLFDVFVLSSLSEGTSVSLLEAMASAVAPVVTDVGGNPTIVDNMNDGMVVKSKDELQLAEAISELLGNDCRRRQFGDYARAKVQKKYSIDRMVSEYTAIYLELLKKK